MQKSKLARGYQYTITAFGARNEVKNKAEVLAAEQIARWIAEQGHILATGAGHTGIMGAMSRAAYKAGGRVYGIGLHRVEPEPYRYLTDWEGYDSHQERQHRLLEMGDAYIVMNGGLGTLMESIEVHIKQFLNEANGPLIFFGEFGDYYQSILEHFRERGVLHKLPSDVRFCQTVDEVMHELDAYITAQRKKNYFNSTYYPALGPDGIYEHLRKIAEPHHILFLGKKMRVLPGVYPSNRFRSSRMFGELVARTAAGKRVADIACGHGTMGIIAALHGARHVVQSDINPQAVESARQNVAMHDLSKKIDIYEGDTFVPLAHRYQQYFDVIYFNPPFHHDASNKKDKLMYAFYSQGTEGGVLDKFFTRAKDYLAPGGAIYVAFSSKDKKNNLFLQEVMERYGYRWSIFQRINANTAADNIIYKATLKKQGAVTKKTTSKILFRLGVASADSGVARTDGMAIRRGVEMAVRDMRHEGVQIELGYANDESSAAGAARAITQLVDQFRPDALIGPTWSDFIDVVAPVLEEQQVTYFTPATSSDVLATSSAYRISGAQTNASKEDLFAVFFQEHAAKRIVYIRKDNSWGRRHEELARAAAQSVGSKLQVIQIGSSRLSPAFYTNVAKELKESLADVVLIDNYDDVFLNILRACKRRKLHLPFVCTLSLSASVRHDLRTIDPANALYLVDAPLPKAFVDRYYHAFPGEEPHRYAYNAYAGVLALTRAFAQKGKKSLRQCVIQDLQLQVFGERFSFDAKGDLRGSSWRISLYNPFEADEKLSRE
jgi:ABC-type branched-subunit amino acid transport system substrate-binding protein/predicted Rossmann-fold nucleotide-binding protein/16S rRNA G966 N2-methylase RsmD